MSTDKQDVTVDAGDSVSFDVTVTDKKTGLPLNLTGATIRWGLAAKATDASPLVAKTTADGIAITDAPNGVFTVTLAPADTVDLNGRYHHEAEVTLGGEPFTSTRGTITIQPTVLK